MPYAEGRIYNDADSHLMELPNWLEAYADPHLRERLSPLDLKNMGRMVEALGKTRDAAHWAAVDIEANLMQLKGWDALGASDPQERTRALDLLGFNRQLIFPTLAVSQFRGMYGQRETDPELLYGGARALNRAMSDFCAHDKRLLPVGFVPLDVPALAEREVEEAVRLGCGGIWLPSTPPGDMSPTHPALDGVWARLQDANVPFLLHIGVDPFRPAAYLNNGRPSTDFVGGGESICSKDYLIMHSASELFVGAMVLDGTLEQFPRLHGGCIELGAMWVVPWLKRLDVAQEIFARTEPALQLPMRAAEYVRRQLRFTPHPTEPVGWMIEQAGEELFMFSSDYPHIEGGRNPLRRFESSMPGINEVAKERFYSRNFADLVGEAA